MCECGCAVQEMREAFRINGTKTVVAYQVFPGCGDCDYGPAVAINFFPESSEFLEGVEIQEVTPNEYGSGRDVDREQKWRSGGFGFGMFDQEDLRAAADHAEEQCPVADYESLSDWLQDNGTDLIRDAMDRFERRTERERVRGEGRRG